MLKDILFCVNSILPVFLIIVLGYILKRANFLTDGFISVADKLVFKCALPVSIFSNIAFTDFTKEFNGDLAVFTIAGIFTVFIMLFVTVTPAIKRRDVRGAVIQGVFRSNVAILGVPLAANLFGASGGTAASVMISFVIPFYNVLAVVILALNMPSDSRKSGLSVFFDIIKNIITNPLIISVVFAVPFSLGYITLPDVLTKSVSYLAELSTPLALISLGASFRFADLKGNVGYSVLAVVLKIAVLPALFCTVGALMGFRGTDLGIILITFGTPTAVSSYIMAKQMKSNSVIASQIIVLSTLLCCVTLIIGSFILKRLNLI